MLSSLLSITIFAGRGGQLLVYKTRREEYRKIYNKNRVLDRDDIFNLVCYRADDVDDAFVFAEGQFDVAVKDADAARKMEQNAAKRRVIPRSVNPDGSLAMVHPHDRCSVFLRFALAVL